MDKRSKGILVGMVFGDGYLNVRTRKAGYISSELVVVHSTSQRDYTEYKAELIRKIFGGKHTVIDRCATLKNGKTYQLCGFSKTNKYFRILKRLIYPYGKKTITVGALNVLTDEGLAIWYMDDGHARRNFNSLGYVSSVSTTISTCCSEEEVIVVCKWFLDKHNVEFKPFREGNGFSIRCNTNESHVFARIIEPYVILSMRYKLSHVADLNLHERQAPIGTCSCGNNIYANRRGGLCDTCYSRKMYKKSQAVMR